MTVNPTTLHRKIKIILLRLGIHLAAENIEPGRFMSNPDLLLIQRYQVFHTVTPFTKQPSLYGKFRINRTKLQMLSGELCVLTIIYFSASNIQWLTVFLISVSGEADGICSR